MADWLALTVLVAVAWATAVAARAHAAVALPSRDAAPTGLVRRYRSPRWRRDRDAGGPVVHVTGPTVVTETDADGHPTAHHVDGHCETVLHGVPAAAIVEDGGVAELTVWATPEGPYEYEVTTRQGRRLMRWLM